MTDEVPAQINGRGADDVGDLFRGLADHVVVHDLHLVHKHAAILAHELKRGVGSAGIELPLPTGDAIYENRHFLHTAIGHFLELIVNPLPGLQIVGNGLFHQMDDPVGDLDLLAEDGGSSGHSGLVLGFEARSGIRLGIFHSENRDVARELFMDGIVKRGAGIGRQVALNATLAHTIRCLGRCAFLGPAAFVLHAGICTALRRI